MTAPGMPSRRDVLAALRDLPATAERFWSNVSIPSDVLTGCWEWVGSKDSYGYGRFRINGLQLAAHRFALGWFEDVPDGLRACHRCDNPPCVNPAHLFLGTAAENTADMVRKCRNRVGEDVAVSKLKASEVWEIRHLEGAGISHEAIAREFGVTRRTVGRIMARQTWTHVPEDGWPDEWAPRKRVGP